MARRTITDARIALDEELSGRLNDGKRKELEGILQSAEADARSHAERFVADREAEVVAARDGALRALTDVRDALDDLAREGADGRIAASDYTSRLEGLRHRQTTAEQQLARAEATVEVVTVIESDPVAWFDELTRRNPRLMKEWPW